MHLKYTLFFCLMAIHFEEMFQRQTTSIVTLCYNSTLEGKSTDNLDAVATELHYFHNMWNIIIEFLYFFKKFSHLETFVYL